MKLFYIEIYDLLCAKVELINKSFNDLIHNKNYNSEIIQKSELDTIQILGKVVGKVGLVWSIKNPLYTS